MTRVYAILIFLLVPLFLLAQDFTGKWSGELDLGSVKLPLVLNIEKKDNIYNTKLDSPDQGAIGIPVDETLVKGDSLRLVVKQIGFKYNGVLCGPDSLCGEFEQNGMRLRLNMKKRAFNDSTLRPQEPKAPFLYDIEDVSIFNKKDSVKLAGVLTLPPYMDNLPAVLLISGSGTQDKDCSILGHKPFFVIADYLTKRGIAVLRMDDRGIGQSEGSLADMTTEDISYDFQAAYDFLSSHKRISKEKIGLLGHSEGGIVASMIAARDKSVGFVILMASPGVRGDSLLLKQMHDLVNVENTDYSVFQMKLAAQKDLYRIAYENSDNMNFQAKEVYSKLWDNLPEKEKPSGGRNYFIASHTSQFLSPWFQYFIKYDPAQNMSKIKCPVLCINGVKDLQVNASINQDAIVSALSRGGNDSVEMRSYEGLNHLFQKCDTGHPREYSLIQETINPQVLKDIRRWLHKIGIAQRRI